MKYYELNKNSPYYSYMQNTSVENSLTTEEKDYLYRTQLAGILFGMYEQCHYSEDEKNYAIYAILNKVDSETAFNNMQRADGLSEVDFVAVNNKQIEYHHLVKAGIL
ncbi:hypothetical protein FW755_08600 [Lonepinella koalarum]|uniref:hypothetical protein n=1 Tax=Lonepinella koalarum TaxID=53417 RepID=UPI0011E45BE3|nr:hypothetical protein [Lonepinella koalarum]TYG35143.1 hypothetical protein FW755_08600 [Lonepinella koalarum]